MALIEIWYDKSHETDPDFSWVKHSLELANCPQGQIDNAPYPGVLSLMEYARPDVVLSIDGRPFLAIELTVMNPSGHNLPQRFSCLVRAAELGVPSIYYYLEYARRSNSDPNPRYLNIRVPLAQLQLSAAFDVPSVTLIWPTDANTKMAEVEPSTHLPLAKFVDHAVKIAKKGGVLKGGVLTCSDPLVLQQFQTMQDLITKNYQSSYSKNSSYNSHVLPGTCVSESLSGLRIVPPESCTLEPTAELLERIYRTINKKKSVPVNKKTTQLLARELSLVYTGTANKSQDGPEHPYPGYLTLLDVLYTRSPGGMTTRDRTYNLVFVLPISLKAFKDKAIDRPTGLNILMEFADIIWLKDAAIVGGYLRNLSAGAVLTEKK